MAFNPFIGWSKTELESALKDAQLELAQGKSTVSVSAGDSSASKVVQMSPMERIRKLYIALNALDAVTYPMSAIASINKTHIAFPHARTT